MIADSLFDLTGRTAFVSAAGQGVGACIAAWLARRGARVGVNDISAERAEATVTAIRDDGGDAMTAIADITDRDQLARAIGDVTAAFGPIDILINNGGVPPQGFDFRPFPQTVREDWDRYIDLNLHGVMHSVQEVLEPMRQRGFGRIVTIVSDAGRYGEPGMAAYAASKAGAAGFMRALSKDVGPDGITCNSLSLGSIEPPAGQRTEKDERRVGRYPMRRLGRPEDVAAAAIYLASNEAGWMTGQTLSINGGYIGG